MGSSASSTALGFQIDPPQHFRVRDPILMR
jgi:hypothetical protein